jgi:hypothetical protein
VRLRRGRGAASVQRRRRRRFDACAVGRRVRGPTFRRYGGAYVAPEAEAVDPKPAIEEKCAPGCSNVWGAYEKCAVRIEEKVRVHPNHALARLRAPVGRTPQKGVGGPHIMRQAIPRPSIAEDTTLAARQGRGDCAGYYMDYFNCIDKCATKSLFKALD